MHLLQPMPLSGEFTLHASVPSFVPTAVFATVPPTASVPTYLGSWQVSTDQRPAVAKPVNAEINAAARTAATAIAPAAAKRHPISTTTISTTTISTKALPATQGSSPRRSPA
jgi:hypothetical protein